MARKLRKPISIEKLKWYAARGFDRHQIGAALGYTPKVIANRCHLEGIRLICMRNTNSVDFIQKEPDIDPPPSAALIALAQFDELAMRALKRKLGEPVDPPVEVIKLVIPAQHYWKKKSE